MKTILTIVLLTGVFATAFCQDSSDVSLISETYDMWTGLWDPIVINGYTYVPSNGGFRILDVRDGENLEYAGLHRSHNLRTPISRQAGYDELLFTGTYASGYVLNDEWIDVGGWLQIFDVSDPLAPDFLSEIGFSGFTPSHILRSGDTLFVGGDQHVIVHGWESWWIPVMYLFDISDPTSPNQLTVFRLNTTDGWPLSIKLRGDLIYTVIRHQLESPGLWIVDLNEPEEPMQVSLFDWDWIMGVDILDDNAVIIGENPDLAVVDISNPGNCEIIGTFRMEGRFGEGSVVHLRGVVVYVFSQHGVMSFDLSDPTNPGIIDELELPIGEYPRFWIEDDRACTSTTNGELLFLDLSNAEDLSILSSFTPETGYFRKIARDDERMLIGGRYDGSPIVNAADPQNLLEIGSLPGVFAGVSDLQLENDMIYASVTNHGLMIFNAVNPDSVWFEGEFHIPNQRVNGFELRDNLVYTTGWRHFRVADISDPSDPFQISEYPVYATDLAIKDDFAYLGGGYMNEVVYENVHILDVSDLDEIEEIGLFEMGRVNQIEVEGDLLFVSDFENQLHIFDVSHPEEPERLSIWSGDFPINRFYVQEPTVFIAAGTDGMRIVDYSQPDHPVETGFYATEDPVLDVNAMRNVVYAVDGRTLKAFDVSRALGVSNESVREPFEYGMLPAYPNPFNACTNISIYLPASRWISLTVHDVLGHKVRMLANGRFETGQNVVFWDAGGVPSGTYFVKLKDGKGYHRSQRVVLLR